MRRFRRSYLTQSQLLSPLVKATHLTCLIAFVMVGTTAGCRQKKEVPAKKAEAVKTVDVPGVQPTVARNADVPKEQAVNTQESVSSQTKKQSPEKVSIVEVLRSANEEASEEVEGGGPMSKTTAARLSSRWMKGTPEDRAKAVLGANFGTRALPQELTRLANQGSEEGLQALLILSRERSGVSEAALSALGQVSHPSLQPKAAAELAKHFNDTDANVSITAMKGYMALRGDGGVNEARQFIAQNYRRPDGRGEYVCAEIVTAVGKLRTEAGDAVLIDELKGAARVDWMPDYGSKVVQALGKSASGRALSPSAKITLENYVEELRRKMPGEDNPPGRQYFEEKMAEVRSVLAGNVPGNL